MASRIDPKTIYKVTILKWEKHNSKRKNHYKYTLIANNLYTHPKILALHHSVRWLYITLLLMCGDTNNDTVTIQHRTINDITTTKQGAYNALLQLQSIQLVTFEKIDSLQLNRREKKRSEYIPDSSKSTKSGSVSFDFDALYQKYPRKLGKSKGLEKCKAQVKTQEDFDQLSLAIEKYARLCRETESRFIKHFDTFMTSWKDVLDPDYGTVEAKYEKKQTMMVDL